MKREGNLYNKIAASENIKLAYYKAQKGKRLKKDVLLFKRNLEKNLTALQSELTQKEVSVGDYHFFRIYDPKERTICAASFQERILHHAIMNILDPIFEKFQIFDIYACREKKGTHQAVKRAFYFTKKYRYFVKLDIRKYFDSIHHATLKHLIWKKIKDSDVLYLLDKIIDSYETLFGRGIPIGNLTSQYFANFYLGFVDRYIKEALRIRGYVRYMDDMVIFGNNRHLLSDNAAKIIHFIQARLLLEAKPPYQNQSSVGVPFLCFLIKPNGIYLSQKSKKRFIRRYKSYLHNYSENVWDIEELADHVTAIIAWTLIAKSKLFRYKIFQRYGLRARTA